jgi:hypothetical protein
MPVNREIFTVERLVNNEWIILCPCSTKGIAEMTLDLYVKESKIRTNPNELRIVRYIPEGETT